MNKEKVESLIRKSFKRKIEKDSKIHNAYLLVHSDKLGIHFNTAWGKTDETIANENQPYFIASVSKLFTATLFGIMVERKMCSFEDPIHTYLDTELIEKFHIYQGKDFTNEIKISHLLRHTSGLHDLMEDKSSQGKTMFDLMVEEPDRAWSPAEALQWSKENLKVHFPPGQGFHYSDTGYHLLGLIAESITEKPLHELFQHYIFEPLEMNHTYLFNHSLPSKSCEYPVANIYLKNINATYYKSMSVIYAGGGIVSTNEDLLKFMKALVTGQLITKDTIEKMKQNARKFALGIEYGAGVIVTKTVPILMPEKLNAWGNAGSTGSFMFYNPHTDGYIIGSFNQGGYGPKGIRFALQNIIRLSKCTR